MTDPDRVPSSMGVQLAVHHLGGSTDDERGHPLLISHATGFHGWCYTPMADRLADRFECIAFDYRGHGDTPRPEGPVVWDRYGDDATAMAEWLADRVGGPINAFGHSMGGACLLMAAHRRPDLFRRLVLFEPIVFPPRERHSGATEGEHDGESVMVAGARRRRGTFHTYQAAIDNYSAKPPLNCFTPEALRAYVEHGFARDPHGVHLKCHPDTEAETFAAGSRHTTWEHLPAIATEVLVMGGRAEPMQPSTIAEPVAERLPHGRYLQFVEMNHFGPMSHPAVVADVVADELLR